MAFDSTPLSTSETIGFDVLPVYDGMRSLTDEEIAIIAAGGDINWGEVGAATAGGAVGGAVGGAIGGGMAGAAAGGVGALPGAAIGGVAGAVGGAVTGAATSIFTQIFS